MPDEDINKEIDEIIGSLPTNPPPEPPVEEPPKEELPKEEPSKEGPPTPKLEEKVGEPAPKVEEELPPEEEVKKEEEEVEEETVESLNERIKHLINTIEELSSPEATPGPSPKPKEEKPKEEVIPPISTSSAEVKEIDFLAGQQVDDLIDDPKKFNAMLNSIYQKAKSDGKEEAVRDIVGALPRFVSSQVKEDSDINAVVNEFYSHNEDLALVRNTVKRVAAQVHSEKPELDMKQVLDEAATRTRTLLGIKKVVKNKNEDLNNPAFVSGKGGKSPVKRGAKTQQDEINELLTH